MKDLYQVIRRPVVTEKSERLGAKENSVVFEVHRQATKHDIQRAVEKIFNVKVKRVRTLRMAKKRRRIQRGYALKKPSWKKAVVTLAEGHRIDFYEGVKA
ncbi:MAG: 50S ribosomal protein L23 [Deltaproteobacteria bacterium RBG_13_61_14]|nr:MAG: 50S ribosomal protein L23 [Deltaproteobacteria bacterium RBG_13_61_14]